MLHATIDAQRKAGFGALLAPFSASSLPATLPARYLQPDCGRLPDIPLLLFLLVYKDCAHDPRMPNGAMRWID
jgi:hypothetical protein